MRLEPAGRSAFTGLEPDFLRVMAICGLQARSLGASLRQALHCRA